MRLYNANYELNSNLRFQPEENKIKSYLEKDEIRNRMLSFEKDVQSVLNYNKFLYLSEKLYPNNPIVNIQRTRMRDKVGDILDLQELLENPKYQFSALDINSGIQKRINMNLLYQESQPITINNQIPEFLYPENTEYDQVKKSYYVNIDPYDMKIKPGAKIDYITKTPSAGQKVETEEQILQQKQEKEFLKYTQNRDIQKNMRGGL